MFLKQVLNTKTNIMKKINLLKPILLLFAVFALSMCDENTPIEFIVADDFEKDVNIVGLGVQNTFSYSDRVDISELIANKDAFKDTEILEVTLTLKEDYDSASINLDVDLSVGAGVGVDLINENVILNKGVPKEFILSNPVDILSLVDGNNMFDYDVTVNSNSTTPLDNDFTVNVSFKVKALTTVN